MARTAKVVGPGMYVLGGTHSLRLKGRDEGAAGGLRHCLPAFDAPGVGVGGYIASTPPASATAAGPPKATAQGHVRGRGATSDATSQGSCKSAATAGGALNRRATTKGSTPAALKPTRQRRRGEPGAGAGGKRCASQARRAAQGVGRPSHARSKGCGHCRKCRRNCASRGPGGRQVRP